MKNGDSFVFAQEPWPDNVKLFQPYEVEQILLPDNASCLAVQAFLKMCNLPFEVEMRWNAEFMSPSGRVPFIKCGAFVVSELEPIVQFAANKGVTLCGKLSSEEKAEMRAYMSLITNVLVNAELYISWIDNDTYNAVTKVRNSSVYPWPLGWLQTRSKRNAVAKRLKALNWGDKTLDQVLADVEQCCNSLSQRLGERDYFFGTTPTPLDALVYGHMRALLSANGPKAALFIKPMTTPLLKHVVRMTRTTGMKLTPQEDYLLNQAFQFTLQRLSPERCASDRSTRIKRSRLCIRNASKENVNYRANSKESITNHEILGFKPFASKQIVITTSVDGAVTCKYHETNKHPTSLTSTATFKVEETNSFVAEIIEDILDKVDETAFDYLNLKYEDKNEFEIVYPNLEKFGKVNDYLDTIEENDQTTDTTVSKIEELINDDDTDNNDANIDDTDDNIDENIAINNYSDAIDNYTDVNKVIHNYTDVNNSMNNYTDANISNNYNAANDVLNYTTPNKAIDNYISDNNENYTQDNNAINNYTDGNFESNKVIDNIDAIVTDSHLDDVVLTDNGKDNLDSSDVDSSNYYNVMKEPQATGSSGGLTKLSDGTDIPTAFPDSKSTLKFPSDEDLSVECLLKYLREKNAAYGVGIGNYIEVADVD